MDESVSALLRHAERRAGDSAWQRAIESVTAPSSTAPAVGQRRRDSGMAKAAGSVDRWVNIVVLLLGFAGVVCFVDLCLAATRLVAISGAEETVNNAAGLNGADFVSDVRLCVWFNAVVAAIGIVVLARLAAKVWRRAVHSRGGVWLVVAGLSASHIFGAAMHRGIATAANARLPEALRAAMSQVNPAWYRPTHSVLAGLAILGIMAAAFAALWIRSIDFYR
jgi:hypothetical protein